MRTRTELDSPEAAADASSPHASAAASRIQGSNRSPLRFDTAPALTSGEPPHPPHQAAFMPPLLQAQAPSEFRLGLAPHHVLHLQPPALPPLEQAHSHAHRLCHHSPAASCRAHSERRRQRVRGVLFIGDHQARQHPKLRAAGRTLRHRYLYRLQPAIPVHHIVQTHPRRLPALQAIHRPQPLKPAPGPQLQIALEITTPETLRWARWLHVAAGRLPPAHSIRKAVVHSTAFLIFA